MLQSNMFSHESEHLLGMIIMWANSTHSFRNQQAIPGSPNQITDTQVIFYNMIFNIYLSETLLSV
jgi:hypothetical protein